MDVRTDVLAYLLRGKKKYTKMFANSYGEHAIESLMGVISSLHHNNPIPNMTIWLSGLERKNAQNKLSFFEQKDRLLVKVIEVIQKNKELKNRLSKE